MNPDKNGQRTSSRGHGRTSDLKIQTFEFILSFGGNAKVLWNSKKMTHININLRAARTVRN